MSTSIHLFGFWRSLATYRVRIALALKGLEFNEDSVDLLAGEQFGGEVARLNPQHSVPVMTLNDTTLTQSLAIFEYIEECFPTPPLLPAAALDRARVRAFALITIADTHPLTVPRTRKQLAKQFNASNEDVEAWAAYWSRMGLQAMEARLQERKQKTEYCFTDTPGLADIALASQAAGAGYFDVSLQDYPAIHSAMEKINQRSEFVSTSPNTLKARTT